MVTEHATILLVDDMPDNLKMLNTYLKEAGFRMALAQSGAEALQRVAHAGPDLILLDVVMPDLNGFETCRQLKANLATRDIPVIFLTALVDTIDKVQGFEAGGVDYLTKPVQPAEVLAPVRAHLLIQQLQQQLQAQNELLLQQNALLAEQKQQLEEVNRSKDKFFAILAHDLRSPFTGFLGLTERIVLNIDQWGKERIQETVQKLHDAAENLYALLSNLLTWSQIQRGHIEYMPETFPLVTAVIRNIALFAANAREKDLTLISTIPNQLTVFADRQMVETVIRNLLSNALKFSHPGGTIYFHAEQREAVVAMTVSDVGLGIPPEALPKLFRIDSRYSQKGTAGERGTGLGLILCQELVLKNRGTIGLDSTPGQGTTVTVTLPAASPNASINQCLQ